MSIAALPPRLFSRVCDYLDERSIFTLNEVCKHTRAIVVNLVSARKIIVNRLLVVEKINGMVWVQFTFYNERDAVLWRICFASIVAQLEVELVEALQTTSWPHIDVLLSKENFRRFLILLKHFTQRTEFRKVTSFHDEDHAVHPEIIANTSYFLEGNAVQSVTYVALISETEEYNHWTKFFEKVRALAVTLHVRSFANARNCLMQAANNAEKISVSCLEHERVCSHVEGNMREIFSRKCNEFHLEGSVINLSELEKLVQLFHALDKQISFTALIMETVNAQFGLVRVNTSIDGKMTMKKSL